MHATSINNAELFFTTYVVNDDCLIVDIGAQDINGSLKQVSPKNAKYLGLDFVEGKGVDVILTDPYVLPLDTSSVDRVICSSCFEHSEMFWVLFLEILRVLKPNGLFYLNVPSNGPFHRYPVDCWRFYPDSGRALIAWAQKNGYSAALLESYTDEQGAGLWNDFIAVFIKNKEYVVEFQKRMINSKNKASNGLILGMNEMINYQELPEDAFRSHPYLTFKTWLLRKLIRLFRR